MKRNTWMLCVYVLFIVSFVILTACTRNEQTENEPANVQQQTEQGVMEGYVIVKNTAVYFISNKKFKTKKGLQRYVDQQKHINIPADTILRFGDENAYKQLKSGYKIKVWFSEILESYPGKMTVNKFEIVEKNDI
ncbi:hypothetical protein CN679_15215 [Bacillus pseudomycoides]|uniref:DUF3221 domain-containing protein n=1 Tax=Bacillus pseudomycoides TaxID=64104 RepID=UPI000BF237F8|nr:DUF3221 domain-containing protein [Bacillus pseudomycoides]PEI91045.1 hypothetical protein CN679_15215 [Bacillus pseudomycoides]